MSESLPYVQMGDVMKTLWDEHEYVFMSDGEGLIFGVDKIGGGTLHKSYYGAWSITVYQGTGQWVGETSFTSELPRTHKEVAFAASGEYACL